MRPFRNIAIAVTAALLVATVALVAPGCGSKKSVTAPNLAATVTGVVSDAVSGATLDTVTVKSSLGASTKTDNSGRFTLGIPSNQSVRIDVKRGDYTLNQVVLTLGSGQTKALSVNLIPAGTAANVPVATGGKVTDASSGATLSLPANFVTASGPVNVQVTGLDPTSSQIKALPGGLDAVDANGHAVYLTPVSFAEYTVTDANGNVLQFNPSAGSGANIELPIPASLRGKPGYQTGDPIECYVYDPNDGKWKTPVPGVVGPSSVDGTTPAIKATIFHLSWYGGAPASSQIACIQGTVTLNGSPVANCDIAAYPGGSARTDANGHYQVQAEANTTVRVDASLYSGTTFRSAEGSVPVGASGAPCAELDLALGAATSGQYTVEGEISSIQTSAPGSPLQVIDLAAFTLELGTSATQVPVVGAKVQVGTGGTWYTLVDGGSGSYTLTTGQAGFALTPGATYSLRVDFTNDGTWDATSQLAMTGVPLVTSPADSSTVGKSFTATWTDAGSGMSGYSPAYWGSASSGSTGRLFATTERSYTIGNGVTDPVSHLTNDPLPAGTYTFDVYTGNGPIYQVLVGGSYTPNVTGTNVTGYFDALSFGRAITLTSTGVTPRLVAGRSAVGRTRELAPTPEAARALAEVRRVQALVQRRLADRSGLRAKR